MNFVTKEWYEMKMRLMSINSKFNDAVLFPFVTNIRFSKMRTCAMHCHCSARDTLKKKCVRGRRVIRVYAQGVEDTLFRLIGLSQATKFQKI